MNIDTIEKKSSSFEPRVSELLLRNVPLFRALSPGQYALLTNVARRRSYPRGSTIVKAGEPTKSLFVIMTGRVHVTVSGDKGDEVILAILRPGEYFGEMGLLDDQPRSASVVARELCEMLVLDKPDFTRCLEENFDLAMTLARGLVQRLRDADNTIGSLALLDVHGRIAQLLLRESEEAGGVRVVTKLSKQDIAKMIGASREMVGRVMKSLQARGYIEMKRDTIILRDRILSEDFDYSRGRSAFRVPRKAS